MKHADRAVGPGPEIGRTRPPPRRPDLRRRNAVRASVTVLVASGGVAAWFVDGSDRANPPVDGGTDSLTSATARLDGPLLPLARPGGAERRPSRHARQDSLWWARDYDASIEASLEILATDPGDVHALYSLGYAEGMKGRSDAATAAFRSAVRLLPDDPNQVALAWGYARAGDRDAALGALGRVRSPDALLREIALVYGALGDSDRAFVCLERAFELAPESLASIDSDPTADAIRSDTRFGHLLERLGAT